MKKIVTNIIVNQLSILVLMLLFYKELTIIDYINVSFYLGSLYLFIGILVSVLQSGFFDFFSTSMKKVLSPKHVQKELVAMRPPSQVISKKPSFFFRSGLPIILCMLAALFFYSL
ncbi:DUF3899 domain-containing protein [Sporosarcina luteola]|uniref:DUF3899 domain-containing protein n=1 Tax=Sporosarcina luteola TaxID=582850 RepID=UPI00203A6360|nr:DUF3899 domain-containing protein [Sporosarcina luteola]MCM3743256.1 DUF3899 domain-containing protein [Sporosarcina luteola]